MAKGKAHADVLLQERQRVDTGGRLGCLVLAAVLCFALAQFGCVGIADAVGSRLNASAALNDAVGSGLNASIAALNFGYVAVGSTSILRETFTNSQDTSINVSNVIVSGPGFNASGISAGSIIEPGQSATLDVTLTPATHGYVTGSITLLSNAKNGSLTIPLTGSGGHSATLSWNASTSAVCGYYVYRGTESGGLYRRLTSTCVSGTSFVDSSVVSGQTYYYVVSAVASHNEESTFSNDVSVLIPTP